MSKKPNYLDAEEIKNNDLLSELDSVFKKLQSLCIQHPELNVICSCLVTASDDASMAASIYVGDSQTQINQIHAMKSKIPAFEADLKAYLHSLCEQQLNIKKTNENDLAEQILAQLKNNSTIN